MSSVRRFYRCGAEEAAEHRNIHEIWNAVTYRLVLIFGDDPTDRERIAILHDSRGFRLAYIKTGNEPAVPNCTYPSGSVPLAHLYQCLQIHQPLRIDLRNDSYDSTGVSILDRRTRSESSSCCCSGCYGSRH